MKEIIAEKDIRIQTKILTKKIADEHRGDKTPVVMNMCRDRGYKFTGRAHIIAFSKQRYV